MRALVERGNLERRPSAGRGLLEDQRDLLALEPPALGPGEFGDLECLGQLETQSLASGLASAPASSSSARNTSMPRSRITSTNMSCSALALATQITSSNSNSPALVG